MARPVSPRRAIRFRRIARPGDARDLGAYAGTIMRRLLAPIGALALIACTDVFTVRTGPTADAREPSCMLELVDADPAKTAPEGLQLIGYVSVVEKQDRAPHDPAVLAKVKPEACKIGGYVVSVASSARASDGVPGGSYHTFAIWRPKPPETKAPRRF